MYYHQPVYSYRDYSIPYRNTSYMNRQQKNKMILEGEGRVTVKPNQAKMNIGVAIESLNVQEAQQENTRISNQIIDALKSIGIPEDDMKTTTYSVFPRYDYVEGKSVLRGYEVEHLFDVTIRDLTKTGFVYDTAIRNGANRSGSIQFLVSNPEDIYQEALTLAIRNAEKKAAVVAETIGAPLQPIPIKITERSIQQGLSPPPLSSSRCRNRRSPSDPRRPLYHFGICDRCLFLWKLNGLCTKRINRLNRYCERFETPF